MTGMALVIMTLKVKGLNVASRQSSAAGGLQERNPQNQPEGSPVRFSSLFGLLGPQFDSRPLFSLLVFLLPRPVDIPFLLLAPEFRRAFPLELVPVDRIRGPEA